MERLVTGRRRLLALLGSLLLLFVSSGRRANGLQAEQQVFPGEKLRPSLERGALLSQPRTLVLVKDAALKAEYAPFFEVLKQDGHELEVVEESEESNLQFKSYGEVLFDNVLLIGSPLESLRKRRGGGGYTPKGFNVSDLLDFLDNDNGNILVLGLGTSGEKGSLGQGLKMLASECGIEVDDADTHVRDFVSAHKVEGLPNDGSVFGTMEVVDAPVVTSRPSSHILYRGVSHLSNPKNPYVIPLLTAGPTAFIQSPGGRARRTGTDIALVSGMQSLNSRRAVFAGSLEMCGRFLSISEANKKFCRDIARWSFQQSGTLEWFNLRHHKVGEVEAPYMYRVKDQVAFSVDVAELKEGKWRPYNANDMQLEFVMLDPYVRLFLDNNGNGTFRTVFKAPDRYGVFKFVVNYKRVGYTQLHIESIAPLRNFKHNDYERFIWGASPYYGNVFFVLVGVLTVSFFFLYHKDSPKSKSC